MKKLRPFLSMIMLALSLSSCAGKIDPNKIVAINGELLSQDFINYKNCCVDVNFSEIDQLIKSNEKFVFYLTSSVCYHCDEFKDKMTSYVEKTNTLVYRMDIVSEDQQSYSEEFKKFFDEYKDYFFVNEEVLTPQVYIVEGAKVADQVSASRYAQKWMFKKAMSEKVTTSKLYSFTSLDAYQKFASERADKKMLTLLLDNSDEVATSIYARYSLSIKGSSTEIALININSTNKDSFKQYFSLDDIDSLIGIGQNETYKFSENNTENEVFLNKYL